MRILLNSSRKRNRESLAINFRCFRMQGHEHLSQYPEAFLVAQSSGIASTLTPIVAIIRAADLRSRSYYRCTHTGQTCSSRAPARSCVTP